MPPLSAFIGAGIFVVGALALVPGVWQWAIGRRYDDHHRLHRLVAAGLAVSQLCIAGWFFALGRLAGGPELLLLTAVYVAAEQERRLRRRRHDTA